MNRLLLTLCALLIFASACKKTDPPMSAEEDLRSGTWRRTSGKMTYKDPFTRGDSVLDYWAQEVPCRLDNSMNFKMNMIGVMNLGADPCTAGEADSKTFTWQVTKDGKRISLYGVKDYFPDNDIDAEILTRTLGYLTIQYRVITLDPQFQTADTFIYNDVLRRN